MSHLSNAHVSPVSRPVPSSAAPVSPGLAIARGGSAKGAAGATGPAGTAAASGATPSGSLMARPIPVAPVAVSGEPTGGAKEGRGPEVVAQELYVQLRESGYSEEQVIALAGELLSLVTADVRSQTQG